MKLYHTNKQAKVPLSLRTKYDPAWDTHARTTYPPLTKAVTIKNQTFYIAPEHEHLLDEYSWYINDNMPYTTIYIPFIEGIFSKPEDKFVKNRARNGNRGRTRKVTLSWIYLVKGLFPDIPGRLVARDEVSPCNLHPDHYVLVPPGRVGNKDFKPRYYNISFEFEHLRQGNKYIKVKPIAIHGIGSDITLDNTSVPAMGAIPTLQEYKTYARQSELTVAKQSDTVELTRNGSLGMLNFLETVGIRI